MQMHRSGDENFIFPSKVSDHRIVISSFSIPHFLNPISSQDLNCWQRFLNSLAVKVPGTHILLILLLMTSKKFSDFATQPRKSHSEFLADCSPSSDNNFVPPFLFLQTTSSSHTILKSNISTHHTHTTHIHI